MPASDGITGTVDPGDEPLSVAAILALAERLRGARRKDSWRVSSQMVRERIVKTTPVWRNGARSSANAASAPWRTR